MPAWTAEKKSPPPPGGGARSPPAPAPPPPGAPSALEIFSVNSYSIAFSYSAPAGITTSLFGTSSTQVDAILGNPGLELTQVVILGLKLVQI